MHKIVFAFFLFSLSSRLLMAQETQIKGFADVQTGAFEDHEKKTSHGFGLGQLDLFTTSQIDEKTTFLSEVVFEGEASGETAVDIERLIIRRYITDYLNISAGKLHTPIGYWSNAYHHGTLIQPTISRPDAVQFEDHGGSLPIHQVGIQFDGSGISKAGFYYNLMLSNGLSKGNVNTGLYTNPMALTFQIGIEPVDNLKFFAGCYFNQIKAGNSTYQGVILPRNTNYTMPNAGMAYLGKNFEVIAEAFNIMTKMDSIGRYQAWKGFIYAGFTRYRVMPYAVLNVAQFDKGNQYFIPQNLVGGILGVRYKFSSTSLLKLEFAANQLDHLSSPAQEEMHFLNARSVTLQYSIGF